MKFTKEIVLEATWIAYNCYNTYNRNFEWNILIIGQTGDGKTSFVQNLAKPICSVSLKRFFLISKISFSSEREDKIRSCFKKTRRI